VPARRYTVPHPIVYFVRHATPDWSRTDLVYHIPPGPPLVPAGEAEAGELGQYLLSQGIRQVWHSPLERTRRTAELAASVCDAGLRCELGLSEMRPDETHDRVRERLWPVWQEAISYSLTHGPLALVTHGGPILTMLQALNLPQDVLQFYMRVFDRGNPVPPAGVWKAVRPGSDSLWDVSLAFVPQAYRSRLAV